MKLRKDPQNVEVYNAHVREYVERFMDLGAYAATFDTLLGYVPQNAKVLDLGCGPGNVAKYLGSRRPDLHITGIDLAPEMVKQAKERNPGCEFGVMDILKADSIPKQFDVLIAAFSLPYINRENAPLLFENAHKLLTENGVFYVSCMEGPEARSGFEKTSFTGTDEMFINYYERNDMERLLNANGFKTLWFSTEGYNEMDGTVTTDLFFIAKKI